MRRTTNGRSMNRNLNQNSNKSSAFKHHRVMLTNLPSKFSLADLYKSRVVIFIAGFLLSWCLQSFFFLVDSFEKIEVIPPDEALVLTESGKYCKFMTHENASIPVVLISQGRSGSSVTWDTISRLTGDPSIAFEFTGGNLTQSVNFFNSIRPGLGVKWASYRLCQVQHRRKVRGISG